MRHILITAIEKITRAFQSVAHNFLKKTENNDSNKKLKLCYLQSMRCLQRCKLQTETLFLSSNAYPSKQVFHLRKDFCYVLIKMAMICNDTHRRPTFEEAYGDRISCDEILKQNRSKTFCSKSYNPNVTEMLEKKAFVKFVAAYAKENIQVLKIFIKDPFFTR